MEKSAIQLPAFSMERFSWMCTKHQFHAHLGILSLRLWHTLGAARRASSPWQMHLTLTNPLTFHHSWHHLQAANFLYKQLARQIGNVIDQRVRKLMYSTPTTLVTIDPRCARQREMMLQMYRSSMVNTNKGLLEHTTVIDMGHSIYRSASSWQLALLRM